MSDNNESHSNQSPLKWLYPAFTVGLLTAALIVAKTGRDALFFQGKGIFQLPLATLLVAAASLPLAMLFVKAMRLWGARPARAGVLLLGALVIGMCAPFLEPGESPLLFFVFMFIPSVFGVMFASLWLLASDVFENDSKHDASRAFGKIGASALIGGMLGGFMAKGLSPYLEAKWLVFAGALLVVAVLGVVWLIHQRFDNQVVDAPNQANIAAGVSPFSSQYARNLLLISMAAAFAGLLIDAQFYISAATSDTKDKASFFANFYIYLNLSSLLLQVFLAHRIHDKVGLRGGLLILPFALVGAATFSTAMVSALSRTVLKVTEGGIKSSIHRSFWEQAFIPIHKGERSFVKLVVDGVGARVAEGAGAVMLFVWIGQVAPNGVPKGPINVEWMAWLTLVTVAFWLIVTWRLKVQMNQDFNLGVPIEGLNAPNCERFPDQCPCTTELGKGVR